jgi:hypothetical protein
MDTLIFQQPAKCNIFSVTLADRRHFEEASYVCTCTSGCSVSYLLD